MGKLRYDSQQKEDYILIEMTFSDPNGDNVEALTIIKAGIASLKTPKNKPHLPLALYLAEKDNPNKKVEHKDGMYLEHYPGKTLKETFQIVLEEIKKTPGIHIRGIYDYDTKDE